MIAWMLGAFAGPPALAGLAVCLCRRRRRHRRLTRDQIAEPEVLADLERRETGRTGRGDLPARAAAGDHDWGEVMDQIFRPKGITRKTANSGRYA